MAADVPQQTFLLISCSLGQLLSLKQLKFGLSEIERRSFPQKINLEIEDAICMLLT